MKAWMQKACTGEGIRGEEINTKSEFMMFGAAAMPLLCCALPV